MPIKGLTDRESIKPQFPRLGKLRKGGKKTSPKKPGPELDYWRFTSENADVEKAFLDAYGEQPRTISVYLPYASLDDNFPTWKEEWVAGGLVHRCDGEVCQIHRKNGGYSTEPKSCPGGCKEIGRLIVVVPELIQAGFIGTVTMGTGGNHDLRAITGVLRAIESEQERKGLAPDLRGIPFSLVRVLEEVSSPGWGENKGKRVRVKKWNVKLWPHRDVAREMLMSAKPTKALPEGHVDFETGEIIEHGVIEEASGELTQELAQEVSTPTPPAAYEVTMDDIHAAMTAVGPSGDPLGKYGRDVWGAVWNSKTEEGETPKYTPELKKYATLLWESPGMVAEWRKEQGNALDEIAAQDSVVEDPPEPY